VQLDCSTIQVLRAAVCGAEAEVLSVRAGRRFGLGLALVNEVVQAHRGRLEISGSPGHGARFAVDLPAASEAETSERAR
jgi:K+-sensing histidine kinase KdpD